MTVSKYKTEPSCNCFDSLSLMVPCKHVFYLRKLHSLSLFESSVILTTNNETIEPITSTKHGVFRNAPTGNGKYTETFRLFQELYKNANNSNEAVFQSRIQLLQMINYMWANGVEFVQKNLFRKIPSKMSLCAKLQYTKSRHSQPSHQLRQPKMKTQIQFNSLTTTPTTSTTTTNRMTYLNGQSYQVNLY